MQDDTPNPRLLIANTLLVAVIFAGDLVVPLGIAGGVLYIVVVLLALWLPERYVYLFASICTALTLIGFVASSEGSTIVVAAANRGLAVFAVWLVAILGLQRKRTETFYQNVLDELPLQVAIFDTYGRFLYLNPASLSDGKMRRWIIGRTEKEYFEKVGRNQELAAERDLHRKQSVQMRAPVSYEEEFLTRNGELRAFLNGFSPVVATDGTVSKVLGFRYDITEHKETAWRLEESLARLQAVLETAGDGIITVDDAGVIQTFNRAAQRMFGYRSDEAVGSHIDDFLNPDSDAESSEFHTGHLLVVSSVEGGIAREFRARRRDGTYFPAEVAISEVAIENQRLFTIILRDLTHRKKTERTLRSYNERLEALRQIDQAILTAESTKAVAQVAIRHLLQMIPAKEAHVALFDQSRDVAMTLFIEANGSVTGPRNIPRVEFGQHGMSGLKSCLEIPLCVHESEIGALCLVSDEGTLEAEHESIAREVAGPLAVAIQDARLFEEVDASRKRLQALSQRLVQVQEQERRSIARELHDQIGQSLTGLKLLLETIELESDHQLEQPVKEAREIARALLGRVRDLSLDLRPAMLDDLGLLPALIWQTDRYTRQTGIEIDFRHAGLETRFDSETETAAYRIVQEALTNVARHSGSPRAKVRVVAIDGVLDVTVKDSGAGFVLDDTLEAGATSGLSGMQERVSLLGGVLSIETSPGRGTLLTAVLPLDGKQQNGSDHD